MHSLVKNISVPGKMPWLLLQLWLLLLAMLVCAPGSARAAQSMLEIPDVPLFVSVNTVPNVFIEMDDSGSMDWTILTPEHFTACTYDASLRCGTVSNSGLIYDYTGYGDTFRNFEYISEADDDVYRSSCTSSKDPNGNTMELCTRRDEEDFDWRARSTSLNVLYYNPDNNYQPWPGYQNASFEAARSYPDKALDGYKDTHNLHGFVYHYWIDDKGFEGSRPNLNDMTDGANGIVDEWDSHIRITVYSRGIRCALVTYKPDTRDINPTIKSLPESDYRCQKAVGGDGSYEALRANIANWFQYYRRRTMVARAGVSTVIDRLPGFRYGFGMINDENLFVEMPEASTTNYVEHNKTLVESFLEHQQEVYGTPLRRGLERVGDYYDSNNSSGKKGKKSKKSKKSNKSNKVSSPIVEACQKNFSVLFSDGFWNGEDPEIVRNDVDKDNGRINGESVTLADVAKYYYDKDLSPLPNGVPTDQFDAADYQHMVTFTIGFGVSGDLVDTDDDGWPNPMLASNDRWYLSDSGDNEKRVDDLWHAAWNSKGRHISAKRPEDLVDGLLDALNNISDRIGGAASGSANGGSISNDTKIFQTKFDAADWHGELLAINVDPNSGVLTEVAWEAGRMLDAKLPSSRKIFTSNEEGNGIKFSWAGISDKQKSLLSINPQTGKSDKYGADRLLYIRGEQAREKTGGSGTFRPRNSVLGDFGHSKPVFVGAPEYFYQFDDYKDFVDKYKKREAAVYVGSNDGMLHAFAEDTGKELFAYVPSSLMGKLNQLTNHNYKHEFYVDGSPAYGDVFINDRWRSVLVGGLRSGGQAVYALDITDPASFAAGNVLWEFTDDDDEDLGYVFGQPHIKKMHNNKWAAIFTSGYNNSESDQNASRGGAAYVFVLFIEDGINGWGVGDYAKILVKGANGLAEPAVADVDGDSMADFIYVGDLDGKMWKLDVTSSNPSSWTVAFGGKPLFTATSPDGDAQSITTRPAIKRHPLGIQNGVLVLFGTGRYLELSDDKAEDIPTQSVYSIWDRDGYYNGRTSPASRNKYGAAGFDRTTSLNQPSIEVDTESGTRVIDQSKNGTPTWFDGKGKPVDRGWVIDLPVEGERVIREIVLRDDLAFFVTLIPEDNVCSAGGSGWLMAVNATSGSSLWFPVFDIDDDNQVTAKDVVSSHIPNGDPNNPVGVKPLSMPNLPVFVFDDRPTDAYGNPLKVFPPTANSARGCGSMAARSYAYTTQTNGSISMITTSAQPLSCGRQNWKQIK